MKKFEEMRDGGVKRSKGGDLHRVNRAITAARVRLIDGDGVAHGVVDIAEAMAMAASHQLDLVEMASARDGQEPVCKLLSYSKFLYDSKKRTHGMKKKQKVVKIKEIKMRPTIGDNDYGIKVKNARDFLGDGHRVKVAVRLRGRELLFKDLAIILLNRFIDDLQDIARSEFPIKREGVQFNIVMVPNK